MGSRSSIKKATELAYIAGFLDGDGSIMLQVKKRSDTTKGYRLMATICFYQDSRHDLPLYEIRQILGIGYISKRNDGITELRINGYNKCHAILTNLFPYIRFKKSQTENILKAIKILNGTKLANLSLNDRRKILGCILMIQKQNYQSSRKKTNEQLEKILDLTP